MPRYFLYAFSPPSMFVYGCVRIDGTLFSTFQKKQPKQQQLYQSLVETMEAIKKVLDILGLLSSLTYSEVICPVPCFL